MNRCTQKNGIKEFIYANIERYTQSYARTESYEQMYAEKWYKGIYLRQKERCKDIYGKYETYKRIYTKLRDIKIFTRGVRLPHGPKAE